MRCVCDVMCAAWCDLLCGQVSGSTLAALSTAALTMARVHVHGCVVEAASKVSALLRLDEAVSELLQAGDRFHKVRGQRIIVLSMALETNKQMGTDCLVSIEYSALSLTTQHADGVGGRVWFR